MASISSPREGGSTFVKVPLPCSPGPISFDSKRGKFVRFFPAVRDSDGLIITESRKVDINMPRFMVVAVNFFKITGGQPQKGNPSNFIGVSSPVVVTDKGAKWEQYIPVWVGNESTPAYVDKWANMKESVENKGGKYTEVLFVISPEYPTELLMLELYGYALGAFSQCVKDTFKYKSNLVATTHTLSCEGFEGYAISGTNYVKPVFKITPFGEASRGYSVMYPRLLEFSRQVDTYGDTLALHQQLPPELASTPKAPPTGGTVAQENYPADPFPAEEYTWSATDNIEDLPF